MRRPIGQDELARRGTVTDLVKLFNQSAEQLRRAYSTLNTTEKLIGVHVGNYDHFSFRDRHGVCLRFDNADEVIGCMKVDFWQIIIDKLEIKAVLSIKRAKELDDLLRNHPEKLPPITEEAVFEFASSYQSSLTTMHAEAVVEVFEFLRPRQSELKTNTEFEIREKVILERWIDPDGWGTTFRFNHYRSDYVNAMENVFRVMDGKGRNKSYRSDLENQINATERNGDGKGETEYFSFKCYKNGNLHLRFRRMDLVDRLNRIAGGKRLRP
jgi:hypothetical protein